MGAISLIQYIKNSHSAKTVHKFGRSIATTTFTAVAFGGAYQMPQVAAATKLRVKAGDIKDTAAGDGARKIVIQGIDEVGDLVSETLITAGASASANSVNDYIRLFRAYVSESGTYDDGTSGSHEADLVIENSAGTAAWLTIDSTDVSRGQSEVAWYTIPTGKAAYVTHVKINSDSTKATTILFGKRENILDAAAPFQAFRLQFQLGGLSGEHILNPETPYGPFISNTDIGFLAKVSVGTGEVDIDFEIILVDN